MPASNRHAERLILPERLRKLGLRRWPFDGAPPPAAFMPAFATRVADCLREIRSGQANTVVIGGADDAGHLSVIAALLERFSHNGDMVASFEAFPQSADEFLQALLQKWGLEVEEQGARGELKALLELFIGHQAGKGHAAYVCLQCRGEQPSEAVQGIVRWLNGLRYEGEFTVRLVVLKLPDQPLADYLQGNGADSGPVRRLVHHEAPGLEPTEAEHYVHTRLKIAGIDRPGDLIGGEWCQLVAAYADGQVPLINQLMNMALASAARSTDAALVVNQRHIGEAADSLGLQLQAETVTAVADTEQPQRAETDEAMLLCAFEGTPVQQVALTQPRVVMGREQDCDIPLDSRFISRFQCLFMHTGRGWYVLDLASTNGTFVNGRRIREHLLRNGDLIAIGRHQLRFVQNSEHQSETGSVDYLSTEVLVRESGVGGTTDESSSRRKRSGV